MSATGDKPAKKAAKALSPKPAPAPAPLRESARQSIDQFLKELDGEDCCDLHALVLAQVEEPLLAAVLEHVHHNQSRAAALLGLNRGTLRKKLRQYDLIEPAARSGRTRK